MSEGRSSDADATLLAVDLGLRTGLALFGSSGRLLWYRSANLGSRARLRKAAWSVVKDAGELRHLVVEGDRAMGEVWARAARLRGATHHRVSPEQWRGRLLLSREQRTGADAKRHADALARAVIEWSGASRPSSAMRHDAAEAILIGLWGVLEVGWIEEVPRGVLR